MNNIENSNIFISLALYDFLELDTNDLKIDELLNIMFEKKLIMPMSSVQKPIRISDELADFIGLPREDKINRIEITKRITEYINKHNLSEGDTIHPNDELTQLLKPDKQLSYFNIQTYIRPHLLF